MKLLEWFFDEHTNETHAKIEYRRVSDWYWVSGYVARKAVLGWLGDTVRRRVDEVIPAAEYSPDCPACLRGRLHSQGEHESALVRVHLPESFK